MPITKRRFPTLFLALTVLVTHYTPLLAQKQPSGMPHRDDQVFQSHPIPASMAECDADQCNSGQYGASTWTFNGTEGKMDWIALHISGTLKVEKWDSSGVVIVRDDTSGFTTGLHVVYKGKLSGNRIQGTAVWSCPSKTTRIFQNSWYAIFNSGPSFVPAKEQSLTGIWHMIPPETAGVVFRFKFVQTGDQVKATWIDTHSWKDGTTAFDGHFVSPTTIDGESQAGDYTPKNPHMFPGHATLDGPNRILGSRGGVLERGPGHPSAPVRSVATNSVGQRNLAIVNALLPAFLGGMFPGSRIEYPNDPCASNPTEDCFAEHPYPRYDTPQH
jgi:hypothetical protein